MTNEKRLSYTRSYFNISVVTIVLFLIAFGILFLNSYRKSGTPAEGNGAGMEGIFLFPVALTFILLLICAYLLYWHRSKTIDPLFFALLTVLAIPVALFGFILAVAIVRLLIGLIHFF